MSYFDLKTNLLSNETPYCDTENNVLWTVQHCFLLQKTRTDNIPVTMGGIALMSLSESGRFTPAPDPTKYLDEGFSRDNMIAVTSFGLMYDVDYCKIAGIRQFDFPRYMQPQDFCFFLYCYSWIFKPLIIITWLNMLWSFWSHKTTPGGCLHTDERLLNFVRGESLSKKSFIHRFLFKIGQKISAYRVKRFFEKYPEQLSLGLKTDSNQWVVVFSLYFGENHPNTKLAKEIYG